ncbi:MAG: SCO family protein [Proteobacteria bacterium]|nr:SCO family protein [Pseudomonadota bacterium]
MRRIVTALLIVFLTSHAVAATDVNDRYDPDNALQISQGAVGTTIGNYQFIDRLNRNVSLHEYAGKPLVISMIFTSCHHVCPMTTKHLYKAVQAAREALGYDSFEVVTIGFDTAIDTPLAMAAFAREQGVNGDGWRFLSGSEETIQALSADLGFIYFSTPRGFDHINQVTIIDRDGKVYNQVYGVNFELPWLVEPLKQLVFNRPESAGHIVASLVDRVRLFCTVYNPASGRYEIDNSLFIQIAIGFIIVLSIAIYLWRGFRPARES